MYLVYKKDDYSYVSIISCMGTYTVEDETLGVFNLDDSFDLTQLNCECIECLVKGKTLPKQDCITYEESLELEEAEKLIREKLVIEDTRITLRYDLDEAENLLEILGKEMFGPTYKVLDKRVPKTEVEPIKDDLFKTSFTKVKKLKEALKRFELENFN